MLSPATLKAARTISRDDVSSFIREPFVEGQTLVHKSNQLGRRPEN